MQGRARGGGCACSAASCAPRARARRAGRCTRKCVCVEYRGSFGADAPPPEPKPYTRFSGRTAAEATMEERRRSARSAGAVAFSSTLASYHRCSPCFRCCSSNLPAGRNTRRAGESRAAAVTDLSAALVARSSGRSWKTIVLSSTARDLVSKAVSSEMMSLATSARIGGSAMWDGVLGRRIPKSPSPEPSPDGYSDRHVAVSEHHRFGRQIQRRSR